MPGVSFVKSLLEAKGASFFENGIEGAKALIRSSEGYSALSNAEKAKAGIALKKEFQNFSFAAKATEQPSVSALDHMGMGRGSYFDLASKTKGTMQPDSPVHLGNGIYEDPRITSTKTIPMGGSGVNPNSELIKMERARELEKRNNEVRSHFNARSGLALDKTNARTKAINDDIASIKSNRSGVKKFDASEPTLDGAFSKLGGREHTEYLASLDGNYGAKVKNIGHNIGDIINSTNFSRSLTRNIAMGAMFGATGSVAGSIGHMVDPDNIQQGNGLVSGTLKGAMYGALLSAGRAVGASLTKSVAGKEYAMLGGFGKMTKGFMNSPIAPVLVAASALGGGVSFTKASNPLK